MIDFIKENWYYIVIGLVVIIALIVIICVSSSKKKAKSVTSKDAIKKPEATEETKKPEVTEEAKKPEVKEEVKKPEEPEEDEDEEITFETEEELDKEAPQPERHLPKKYRIVYDKEAKEWCIKKDGAKRVIRRVKTKAEALKIAKELCKNQELNLSVQKKDGKFQKMKY